MWPSRALLPSLLLVLPLSATRPSRSEDNLLQVGVTSKLIHAFQAEKTNSSGEPGVCGGKVLYAATEQPFMKPEDRKSVIAKAQVPFRSPRVAGTPAELAISTGEIPTGWGADAQEKGIHRIAVIGAGPSGLMSAMLLSQEGFDVEVFEATSKVGGQSSTYYGEDRMGHDLATKWVPSYSTTGPGTTPLQQTIIEKVKEEGLVLLPTPGTVNYDTSVHPPRPMTLPYQLQSCSQLKLASDMMAAVNILEQLELCPGINGPVDCGIAEEGETLQAWVDRNELECFGKFLAYYGDALGAGPSLAQEVGFQLKSRAYFLLRGMLLMLVAGGAFNLPQHLTPPRGRILQQMARPENQHALFQLPPSWLYQQGYDGFWKLFVDAYDLKVSLDSAVTQVEPVQNGVRVVTGKGASMFDHVVVAAPPLKSRSFLPESCKAWWTDVETSNIEIAAWLVNPSQADPFQHPAHQRPGWVAAVFHPQSCEAGLGDEAGLNYNGEIYSVAAEGGVYLSLALPKTGAAPGEGAAKQLEDLGVDLANGGKYAKIEKFEWPSYVQGASFPSYYRGVQELQGKNHLSFVGEVIGGNNVPALMDHTVAFFISGAWQGQK